MILKELSRKSNEKKTENKKQKRYSVLEKAIHAAFILNREEAEGNRPNLYSYAQKEGISRTTLYKIMDQAREGFSENRPGPKLNRKETPKDKNAVELEKAKDSRSLELEEKLGTVGKKLSTKEKKHLIRTILQMAVTPASTGEIREVIKEAFGIKIGKSKIKKILNEYAKKAREILDQIAIEKQIKQLAIDEVFSGSRPILTGVELNSFAVVICEAAFNRNSETWRRVLGRFENLELVVSDQAQGIIKAVKEIGGLEHQWDIFHFKRDASKLLRHLESQAYKKIELEDKAEKKIQKNKLQSNEEKLEAQYEERKKEALKVINLFDEVEKAMNIIYQALDVFDKAGNLNEPRKSLRKISRACDRLEKASSNKKIKNIAKRARNPHLLLYLRKLNECFQSIILLWEKNTGVNPIPRAKVFNIMAKHWYYSNHNKIRLSFRQGETKKDWLSRRDSHQKRLTCKHFTTLLDVRFLQMALKDFNHVYEKVTLALSKIFRASSLVESWNSRVRICQQIKKGLHRDFLALFVLRWNLTPFEGGKRKGKSPFQILGFDYGNKDWLDFLLAPLSSQEHREYSDSQSLVISNCA